MSHPSPHHDPENVRSEDSKFAPRAKHKALKKAKEIIPISKYKTGRQSRLLREQVKKIHTMKNIGYKP